MDLTAFQSKREKGDRNGAKTNPIYQEKVISKPEVDFGGNGPGF